MDILVIDDSVKISRVLISDTNGTSTLSITWKNNKTPETEYVEIDVDDEDSSQGSLVEEDPPYKKKQKEDESRMERIVEEEKLITAPEDKFGEVEHDSDLVDDAGISPEEILNRMIENVKLNIRVHKESAHGRHEDGDEDEDVHKDEDEDGDEDVHKDEDEDGDEDVHKDGDGDKDGDKDEDEDGDKDENAH